MIKGPPKKRPAGCVITTLTKPFLAGKISKEAPTLFLKATQVSPLYFWHYPIIFCPYIVVT